MKIYEFDGVIQQFDGMDAAFVEFPFEVQDEFGVKGQVKVKVTFDDIEYRGSLAKMSHHCHFIGLTKEIRKLIGKNPGDIVRVTLKKDEEPRVVDVPEDLNTLWEANQDAKKFFDKLSYTNQKEFVQWITSAKRAETRAKRLEETIKMLSNGVKKRS